MFKPFLTLLAFSSTLLPASSSAEPQQPLQAIFANLTSVDEFTPVDIDDDGDLDILAGSNLYTQNANGSFDGPSAFIPPHQQSYTILGTGKITAGDPTQVFTLETDRTNSLATPIQYHLTAYRYTSDGKLSRPSVIQTFPATITNLQGGDLDQDGYFDLILQTPTDANESLLSISWGNSQSVTEIATLPTGESLPNNASFIDLNHNGLLDIIYSGTISSTSGICVIYQSANHTFSAPDLLQFSNNTTITDQNWKFADLNGDRLIDLYRTTSNKEFIYSLQSENQFSSPITTTHPESLENILGVDSTAGTSSIVHTLLIGDETTLITLRSFTYNLPESAQTTNLESQLSPDHSLLRNNRPFASLVTDINQDGKNDILLPLTWPGEPTGKYTSANPLSQLSLGSPNDSGDAKPFQFSWLGFTPISQTFLITRDFNADGFSDIIAGKTPAGNVVFISNQQGDGWQRERELNELLPDSFRDQHIAIHSITVIDINLDGYPDLNVHLGMPKPNSDSFNATNSGSIGNGSGGISEIIAYPISLIATDALGLNSSLSASFLDLNLDGKMDLIYNETIADALGNPLAIPFMAFNSPDGRFRKLTPFNASNGFFGTRLTDYNGDGTADVCGVHGYTSASLYGPSRSIEYDFLTPYNGAYHDSFQAFLDIDNDYDADFLFRSSWTNSNLFSLKNPLVNSDDPAVRYALNAGLMATDTQPDADPDHDGLSNLVEYMFGGIPSAQDPTSILPQLDTTFQSGSPRLTASFKQRTQLPAGKQYHLYISDDLQTWIDSPLSSGSVTPIDATWQQFNITIDPSSYFPNGKKAFIQWAVE